MGATRTTRRVTVSSCEFDVSGFLSARQSEPNVPLIGNSHSSIFDAGFTTVTGGRYLKCLSWYDNE